MTGKKRIRTCLYRYANCVACGLNRLCHYWDMDLRGRVCTDCVEVLTDAEDSIDASGVGITAPTDQFLDQHK